MEQKIIERIKELSAFYNLDVCEFAVRCGLSSSDLFLIKNNADAFASEKLLKKIADFYGSNMNWLLHGEGDILAQDKISLPKRENGLDDAEKNMPYLDLKTKNDLLEKEVERLWQLIRYFTTEEKKQQS